MFISFCHLYWVNRNVNFHAIKGPKELLCIAGFDTCFRIGIEIYLNEGRLNPRRGLAIGRIFLYVFPECGCLWRPTRFMIFYALQNTAEIGPHRLLLA